MEKIERNDGYYVTKPLTVEEFDTLYQFTQKIKMSWYKPEYCPMRNAYLPGNIHWLVTLDTRIMQVSQMCSITCCAACCSSTRPIYSVEEVIHVIQKALGI